MCVFAFECELQTMQWMQFASSCRSLLCLSLTPFSRVEVLYCLITIHCPLSPYMQIYPLLLSLESANAVMATYSPPSGLKQQQLVVSVGHVLVSAGVPQVSQPAKHTHASFMLDLFIISWHYMLWLCLLMAVWRQALSVLDIYTRSVPTLFLLFCWGRFCVSLYFSHMLR